MNYIYFKNRFIKKNEAKISINDRSFRFGDGIFETILVSKGKILDFKTHHKRLQSGIKYFDINIKTTGLEENILELIKKNKLKEGLIRIIISAGENNKDAVGYLPGKQTKPYLIIESFEREIPGMQNLKLYVSSFAAFYKYPCKVNSSFLYVQAIREAKKQNSDNAILLNPEGFVCETASGNIFWIKGDTLYTPSRDLPFIPGTIRKKILDICKGTALASLSLRRSGCRAPTDESKGVKFHEIKEGKFKLKDLLDADEVFMTNIGYLVASVKEVTYLEAGKKVTKNFPKKEKTEFLRKEILNLL